MLLKRKIVDGTDGAEDNSFSESQTSISNDTEWESPTFKKKNA